GKTITGKIVSDTKDGIVILTDPEDSTKVVEVKRTDIDQVKPSAVSLMPEKLLQPLNEDEVLDLLAYLLSRGDPNHPMVKKETPEPKKGRQKKQMQLATDAQRKLKFLLSSLCHCGSVVNSRPRHGGLGSW